MFKKMLTMLIPLAAIAVLAFGVISSGAWFTDTGTNTTAALSSGTLLIDDAKLTEHTLGTISNLAPEDVTNPVVITIENGGTLDLAWFGDLIVGNSVLRDVIYIDYAEMQFLSPTGTAWEPVDNFILDGKGHGSWPTTWGGPENYATLAVFDGNPNMAPGTPYEFMGALKPGYKYQLTLKFGFYYGAGNQYQNAGPLTNSFKVDATQINATAMNALYPTLGNHEGWMNLQIAKQIMP